MKPLAGISKALGSLSILAILAGCGGAQNATVPPTGAAAQSQAHKASGSWMAHQAKGQNLLYASDNPRNNVYVFSYPEDKQLGTLTGFDSPVGECVDSADNVWIVNQLPAEVIEYAHGGTTPIGTLSVPGQWPYGCAIDLATGNLAVTHDGNEVSIYQNAQGTPTTYTASNFISMHFCGYDNKSNLFAVGYDGGFGTGAWALAELPNGGNSLEPISLNQNVGQLSIVQWDGKYLAVGGVSPYYSHNPVTVYQVQVSGSQATVEGTTLLRSRSNSPVFTQFWIQGKTIIQRSRDSRQIGMWRYPAGGDPVKLIRHVPATDIWGIAVSLAKT